jgi:RNA polymerase sigma factor (sigma-70 family)
MGNDSDRNSTIDYPNLPDGEPVEIGGNYDFSSYRRDLRKFVAHQLHDRQAAEDVVQDIFLKIQRYPAREALNNPRAWLWRIAWRVLHEARLARGDPRAHIAVDPKTIEAWSERSSTHVAASAEAHAEAADDLLAALQDLPTGAQIAIIRSRRDGWSLQQIADELGCSTEMVKKHITRALKHFAALSRAEAAGRRDSP